MDWPGINRTTGPTGDGAHYAQNVSYSVGEELRERQGMQLVGSGAGIISAMAFMSNYPKMYAVHYAAGVTERVEL